VLALEKSLKIYIHNILQACLYIHSIGITLELLPKMINITATAAAAACKLLVLRRGTDSMTLRSIGDSVLLLPLSRLPVVALAMHPLGDVVGARASMYSQVSARAARLALSMGLDPTLHIS
jgi:hypothetical protein